VKEMGGVRKQDSMPDSGSKKWLLLFYTVPAKPVNARIKIWRRLAKAGAVQFKSAVYILPNNEETYELCQWLVSEVASMKGDGAFVRVERIETLKDEEIIDLFNRQREKDYGAIEKKVDALERKLGSIRKGADIHGGKKLPDLLSRHIREFEDVRKTDFFSSRAGVALQRKIEKLLKEMRGLSGADVRKVAELVDRDIEAYQGKTWATRKKPFVDRMASAWLIRKFIDKKPVFTFIDEKEVENLGNDKIAFDIRSGEFTHIGDMCTFEVLVKTFGLKDNRLKKMAEIIHELDIKDEKYKTSGAQGIEDILAGIRKTEKEDMKILEKGMEVFEMLYASKT